VGDPLEVFPLWECERCGFSERFEKPDEPKKTHDAPAKALAKAESASPVTAVKISAPHDTGVADSGTRATRRTSTKRAIPPDVEKMLEIMNRNKPKLES
jgi:hypothetical protein